MWRSAVQVCLGLHIAVRQCAPQALEPGTMRGGLAQLARAPALQAGGQRFESVILHDSGAVCDGFGNHNYQLLITNYSLERDL